MRTNKKLLIIIIASVIMLMIHFLPLFSQVSPTNGGTVILTAAGKTSIGILIFVIILWITEVVSFPVAALLGVLLATFFNLLSFQEIISLGFGNPIVIFFMSALIISSGLVNSGLMLRLTNMAINIVGFDARRLIFAFLAIGAFMSMWVTNMAAAAILLPVGASIINKAGLEEANGSNFGKALMISIAWGTTIGGLATPVGNGANIMAIGFLNQLANLEITFLSWMKVGLPIVILLLPISWFLLIKIFPPEEIEVGQKDNQTNSFQSLSKKEIKALVIFSITILLWLSNNYLDGRFNIKLSIEAIALCSAILFFLPGIDIINWKTVQKEIDWGSIVLIACGVSLGMLLFETGAAEWLGLYAFSYLVKLDLPVAIYLMVLFVEFLKVCFSSNTVAGAILVPMIISIAQTQGLDAWTFAGPVAIATSMAFLLVSSSPTNVIPYSSGCFSIKDFAKAGFFITLTAPICITCVFYIYNLFM